MLKTETVIQRLSQLEMLNGEYLVNLLWEIPATEKLPRGLLFELKHFEDDTSLDTSQFTGVYLENIGFVFVQGAVNPEEDMDYCIVKCDNTYAIETFFKKKFSTNKKRYKVFCFKAFEEPVDNYWLYNKEDDEKPFFAVSYVGIRQIDDNNIDLCEKLQNYFHEAQKILNHD